MKRPIVALALVLPSLAGCFPYGSLFRENAAAYLAAHPDGLRSLSVGDRTIRYAVAGRPGRPLVLLIHGSPGSWEGYAGYLMDPALTQGLRIVAVDRPGYGGSDPGHPMPSLEAQAALMARVVMAEGGGRPAVVLGHSFGGPVAVRLAMDRPDLVAGLVLVAASVDPGQEKTKWFQIPASWGLLRWLVPKDLDVCNQEILPLRGELKKMLPLWPDLRLPVHVIQGMDDALVPPENADFIRRQLVNATVEVQRVPGLGHFVPWARPDLLRGALLEMLSLSGKPPHQGRRS